MDWHKIVKGKDIFAFFSKDNVEKDRFIRMFLEKPHDTAIHFLPKRRIKKKYLDVYTVPYEDLTKTPVWLKINSIFSNRTLLIMENPTRYPKITSEKVQRLQRLSLQVEKKIIVDIVPFTLDIQYLYTPFSYLDRSILGYAHYYAFRKNYNEINKDGKILKAHNPFLLAQKINNYCYINYERFSLPNRQIIDSPVSSEEHKCYLKLRNTLFEKEKTPQRIITQLADLIHSFPSRLNSLSKLLQTLKGKTVVFTNLKSYAENLKSKISTQGNKNIHFYSYYEYNMDLSDCKNIIYMESPIVKSYFLLDVEASLNDKCQVFHFLGNTKVDIYLYNQIVKELKQIDKLIHALRKEQNR